MKSYKLSFATIHILDRNMAEIIADEGVEMDEIKVVELHDFLLSNIESPQLLLINKKHTYTYTFKAQTTIAQLKEIEALAVVVSSSGAAMSTETLMSVNETLRSKMKMFQDRTTAISWLNTLKTSQTL